MLDPVTSSSVPGGPIADVVGDAAVVRQERMTERGGGEDRGFAG